MDLVVISFTTHVDLISDALRSGRRWCAYARRRSDFRMYLLLMPVKVYTGAHFHDPARDPRPLSYGDLHLRGCARLSKDAGSLIAVPETPSVFHRRAQRNAFRRRDARLQSRLFAPGNQRLTRFLRLSAMISHYFKIAPKFSDCS